MATESLRHYTGDLVIYVGEGDGGCTGDNEFHRILREQWREISVVHIPQWDGLHDVMFMYQRRY
jgi:hypothetical protein